MIKIKGLTAEDLNGFMDAGTEFHGELRFRNTFRIDGKLKGRIVSENTLIVGEAGEVDAEIARYAERMKKTKDVVRARMEKDGDLGSLRARIREEKTLDLLKANARMEFE